jgi:hypothetical protein
MPEPDGVTKLRAFPRSRLIERELFACSVSEVDLLEALGSPSAESQPGLGEGRPYLYWDLVWPCGIVMGLQFDQLEQRLVGFLDEPEVEHALWHIGIKPEQLWTLERDDPDRFAVVCDPAVREFELWVNSGGDEVRVLTGLTRREAECRRATLEARAVAGQTYFVRGSSGEPPPAIDLAHAEGDQVSREKRSPRAPEAPLDRPAHVRQALIDRAAGTLAKREKDEAATPVSEGERSDGERTVGGLEGFSDDDFRSGTLLDP